MSETPDRKTTLELISEVDHFMSIHKFMDDEELDLALSLVVKLMKRPDVPAAKAHELIIQLQAISAKMQMSAAILGNGNEGKDNKRKNVYYSAYHALNSLVDALKFAAPKNRY